MAKRIFLVAGLVALAATSLAFAGGGSLSWQLTPTGSTARLRGLSAVNAKVAWTSGSAGTVLRTVDRGDERSDASDTPPGNDVELDAGFVKGAQHACMIGACRTGTGQNERGATSG